MANSNPNPSPSRSSSPNPNPNPGPNPIPSPPKESKWRGPMMDAYGEPIGGGEMAPAWALAPLELSCACSP